MARLYFAAIGAAALALGACGGNDQDVVENVGENLQADELNALADNAAMDAQAEIDALGNQQQQLQEEAPVEQPSELNVVTAPSEVEDDVQGM